jgi:hypothetical protein
VAKRLDREKEAKRLKVIKQGFVPVWKDLRTPTGSRVENRAIAKQVRKLSKKAGQAKAFQTPVRKSPARAKVKVFRRRKGEGIVPVAKNVKN